MFLVPLPEVIANERANKSPIGRWKDGPFSCLSLGVFHSHLWCAFCCCNILLGQVMTRMKLSWTGQPTHGTDADNTFKTVMILVVSFLVFTLSLDAYEYSYIITGEINEMSPMVTLFKVVGYLSFFSWSVYSMTKTRYHIRSIYSIPETRCHGYEDMVMSSCCCCCTVAQMARHTGGYEHNPPAVFSTTGLSSP
jgi:Cys-rich protein (TIGR01571 family)